MSNSTYSTNNGNKKYKLVIFDWDGTLMNSMQNIIQTLRSTLLELGYLDRSDNDLKDVIGLGLSEAVQQLYPEFTPEQNQKFSNLYRSTFLSSKESPSVLFDGVSGMIKQLHQQGVMIAIATGKGREGLEMGIDDSGLREYFHASRCADETFSKPNPQMLEELLDEFSLTADQAIMIGDSIYDIQMANNIKMDSIAVSYGVHESERLDALDPKKICDNISELECFLVQHASEFK